MLYDGLKMCELAMVAVLGSLEWVKIINGIIEYNVVTPKLQCLQPRE